MSETTQQADRINKITKATIKNDLFLYSEWSEVLTGHKENSHKLESGTPVHDDLKAAFAELDKHLAILCDQSKTPKTAIDLETASAGKITARGFTISGKGDSTGYILNGVLAGEYGVTSLVTPLQKMHTSEYKFMPQLTQAIQVCCNEVNEYLFNGKAAPEQQLDMFAEPDGADDLDIPVPGKDAGDDLDEQVEQHTKTKKATKKAAKKK